MPCACGRREGGNLPHLDMFVREVVPLLHEQVVCTVEFAGFIASDTRGLVFVLKQNAFEEKIENLVW